MRRARVFFKEQECGVLSELETHVEFAYHNDYEGPGISVTLPVQRDPYVFDRFPSFFDGLLPEGWQLDALLKQKKMDRDDYFSQLLEIGDDLVGAISVKRMP